MTYDESFFEAEGRVARQSAEVVIPWLYDNYKVGNRTIDIGCGTGEWVLAAIEYLGGEALGVDLHAPNPTEIPRLYADISNGIDCTGWHLAICLETAEHLPESSAELLVAGLAKADLVLFSAATPGQPGIDHINCRPQAYWHDLFRQHGFTPTFIGGRFDERVEDFYRRNLYIYERGES